MRRSRPRPLARPRGNPYAGLAGAALAISAAAAMATSSIACRAASDAGTVRLGERQSPSQMVGERITPASFRASHAPAAHQPPASDASPFAALPTRTSEEADRGVSGVVAVVGAPEPPPVVVADDGRGAVAEVLIDQVVGQINGEPVFADAFFSSMDARLRAEAARVDRSDPNQVREFVRGMSQSISTQLMDQMRNQLLLDEFRASLSPQERVGITALIEKIQTDLRRGALGSREAAERQLRSGESGQSFEQEAAFIRDRVMIREHLNRTINNRVSVSSRDVEQEYERRWSEFNPPPIAVLRIIRVASADRQSVADALASGRSFSEVAAEYSRWRPEADNLHEVELPDQDMSSAVFFGIETLNEPAQSLTPGAVAGPIETGSTVWWLRLDEIRQPPGRSLFEVQLEIESEIHARRFEEEQERYFAGLLERSNFSDRRQMVERLTAFGARRYLGIVIPELEAANLQPSLRTGSESADTADTTR
ncbi:MAG: peptidylprolyl isomerase [Phycisphaerales bacterium]